MAIKNNGKVFPVKFDINESKAFLVKFKLKNQRQFNSKQEILKLKNKLKIFEYKVL